MSRNGGSAMVLNTNNKKKSGLQVQKENIAAGKNMIHVDSLLHSFMNGFDF